MSLRLGWISLVASAFIWSDALARPWMDSNGNQLVEGEFVAVTDDRVVLKNEKNELVSVPIASLSKIDRDFVERNKRPDSPSTRTDVPKTWSLRSGLQLFGKVDGYDRRQLTVQRYRGKIYVNGQRFDNGFGFYNQILFSIVNHFERIDLTTRQDFRQWVLQQKGRPKTFVVEGPILALQNGQEYLIPFFLFTPDELAILEPGWKNWQEAMNSTETTAGGNGQSQSTTQTYPQDQVTRDQLARDQMAAMQLNLLAVTAGVTDLWQVWMYPGGAGYPVSVIVPARNSYNAMFVAQQRFPQFALGPARKLSWR